MLARDLTTTEVVTEPFGMPLTHPARLLADRGISSAPFTTPEGSLLGIVTEADLLRRLAAGGGAPASWLPNLPGNADRQADNAPDAIAEHCAHLMGPHKIKRLPVLQEGRLVAILSRADLPRAILEPHAQLGTGGSDAQILATLRSELRAQAWAGGLYASSAVQDGVVTLFGFVRSEALRHGLCVLAQHIPGVVRVDDQMIPAPHFVPGEYV